VKVESGTVKINRKSARTTRPQRLKAGVTAQKFRRMVLRLPGALEAAHMGHPDFRVNGKFFATLGCPDQEWGMVKLTPKQQAAFVRAQPEVFDSCSGVYGRRGSTNVRLEAVTDGTLRRALFAGWRNTAPKPFAKQLLDG
jgi:hypothetical protein